MITIHQQICGLLPDRLAGQLAPGDVEWMDSHLQVCTDCHARFDELRATVQGVRREVGGVTASAPLVRRTQSGVRRAAVQMRKRQERMAPLWIACAIAGLWAVLSLPLIWEGTRWFGHHTSLPMFVWQSAAVVVWLMPTGIAIAMGIWTRGLRVIEE
jgi:anti-sigma factor RsiW